LRLLLVGAGLVLPGTALAQAFAVSATTDHLYRGYSLSAGRPALVASMSLDRPDGFYLSASGIVTATRDEGLRPSGAQVYAGYARRVDGDSSWDVGIAHTDVSERYAVPYRVTYSEVYGGWTTRNLAAHLYYSPAYLGEDTATLYATGTVSRTLAAGPKIFARAGVLLPVDRKPGTEIARSQYDVGAGLAQRFGPYELQGQVSWFGPDDDLIAGRPQGHTAFSLSVTRAF